MQALKWALLSVPAIAGLAIGAKHIVQASSGNDSISKDELSSPPATTPRFTVKTQLNSGTHHKSSLVQTPQKLSRPEPSPKFEENSIFKKLDDYTFKLFSPCKVGTGWILDYQIPEDGSYPTVWYIATVAHAVNTWQFDSRNTYNQKLPRKQVRVAQKHITEASKHALWTDSESCALNRKHKTFDFNIARHDDVDKSKSDLGAISQNRMKSPKLFWVALDLFEKGTQFEIPQYNFKDFAVVEITFESEEIAKEMTRGFADKYKVGSKNEIDIFNEPLDYRTTKNNSSHFYSLGYPDDKGGEKIFLNYNWKGGRKGDMLTDDPANHYKIPPNPKVRGFISAKHFLDEKKKFSWGNHKYRYFGHFYYTKGTTLGAGASGSMAVDENGKLLGIRAMEGNYSLFTPLRSDEVIYGNIKTPKYDLILGADKQKSSYKKQVEDYLLKYGKKTWLSSSHNWTYPVRK